MRVFVLLHKWSSNRFEVKYLGLPMPDGRITKGKFANLQSRLGKLLMEWGDVYWLKVHAEILTKSIPQAIPTKRKG
jgi:hypothetical protein